MDWWAAQAQSYEDQFNKKQAEEISGDVVSPSAADVSSRAHMARPHLSFMSIATVSPGLIAP